MLDNKPEIPVKLHIKNVSNPCYIPPKNGIVPLLKNATSLKIVSWNVNVKSSNNSNKLKQMLIAQQLNDAKP